MVKNKNKVISLPKEYHDNNEVFVCPCPVCVEKMYTDQEEKAQIEQAKDVISDIFQNSAFKMRDFQIQVAYADEMTTKQTVKALPETKPSRSATKAVLTLTTQFNKKYRHPLMCQLNALATDTDKEILVYESMVENGDLLENRLWKLENIAQSIDEMIKVLESIQKESFIVDTRVSNLMTKAKVISRSNKIQLKKHFIRALKVPEFEPHCTYDDFHLPYY